jgi:hypothetical protein
VCVCVCDSSVAVSGTGWRVSEFRMTGVRRTTLTDRD